MAHHEAAHDHHVSLGPHPMVPEVRDEAPDSPAWLPVLGFAIFVLLALYGGLHSLASRAPQASPQADAAEPAGEAPAPDGH